MQGEIQDEIRPEKLKISKLYKLKLHQWAVTKLAIDDTNALLYAVVGTCNIWIIDLNEKEQINEVKLGKTEITDIVIRPEGRKIYISTSNF